MTDSADAKRVLIIGGGFCGLATAIELGKLGIPFVLAEQSATLGGLSATSELDGQAFELGPHIYFDKDPEVVAFWTDLVGARLKSHQRRNRLYYDGKYVRSPLSLVDATVKLGPLLIARLLLSFAASRFQRKPINNARDWVTANFGSALYERFFKVYNEKLWGLDCTEIDPNWAGQRIKSSLPTMLINALRRDPRNTIKTFLFPAGGSSSVAAAQERRIRANAQADLRLGSTVARLERTDSGFAAWFANSSGPERFSHVISTIHLADLADILLSDRIDIARMRQDLSALVYRKLILVNLVFAAGQFRNMDEHWIDIHDPAVRALRVTNFSNYATGTNDGRSAVSVEYNCFEHDELDLLTDTELVALAHADLQRMGLIQRGADTVSVTRIARAYPVYFKGYRTVLDSLEAQFSRIEGLTLAGRNAMYRWNNMHHSVKVGLLAARNVAGAAHDLAQVRGNVTFGKDSD